MTPTDQPAVEDDAIHMRNPLESHLTLCDARITDDTNIGTYAELRADPGAACWTCEDVAGMAIRG